MILKNLATQISIRKQSGSQAIGGINLNEIVEDKKALSRVWELYEGLVKKYR